MKDYTSDILCLAMDNVEAAMSEKDFYKRVQLLALQHEKEKESVLADLKKAISKARLNIINSSGVDISPNRPLIKVQEEVIRILSNKGLYYHAGNYSVLTDENLMILSKSDELLGFLNDHIQFYLETQKSIVYKQYPHIKAFFNSQRCKSLLDEIRFISSLPIYNKNIKLLRCGYHPDEKIFVQGDYIIAEKVLLINKVLDTFCFKYEADRTNALAMMLTCLFHQNFPGKVPCVLIEGNQPGVGKGELAQVLAVLKTGKRAPTITYTNDGAELEKRMGASVKSGSRVILLDNVKQTVLSKPIGGPVLERTITDAIASFRLLGASSTIEAPNNILTLLTYNGGDLTKDLRSRSINCFLEYKGNPEERSFEILDIVSFVEANRFQIVGELIFLVENWKNAGRPYSSIDHRFKPWAQLIGGILKEGGFDNFLENKRSFTVSNQTLAMFICKHLGVGNSFSAKEIFNLILGVKEICFINRRDINPIVLGRVLSSMVGKEIVINDRSLFLRNKKVENTGIYWLEEGSKH